jgi:hypothetical protein
MPAQRRDYILTQIELLGKFAARLNQTRDESGLHEAIQLAQHLQEKLFARPPAEFLQWEVGAQLAALRQGESKENGDEKCLIYARLLNEMASLYAFRGKEDLAAGARQLALHVVLVLALEPGAPPAAARALAADLLAALGGRELHPPVQDLVDRYTG